jgi:UDP-N-acetylmuramoyl-L-alanyl-D-glutamate--2,6-diaminopimelate ligase
MGFDYSESNSELVHMSVSMPGTFSVYNAMAAIAVCRTLNIDLTIIKSILSDINVRGRAQRADISPEYVILVDYAHNTVSLKSLLTTLRLYNPKRLVCLFGCGGNRAKERRYGMGEVAAQYADFCIVTSDNPRFEEPQDIIDDILVGVRRGPSEYVAIPERDRAIVYAVENAVPGDIVVIAGKGHEDYQEIKGVKYHMDDIELVRKAAESL